MKYLSLFSGIGGFELGIQQAYEISNMGRTTSSSNTENRRYMSLSNDSDGNGRRTDTNIPECVGFSEIDKYAIQIYQKHFKETTIYETDKGWFSLQGTEWRSIQPTGDKSDFESWSDQQSETWWDRVKQQPKNFIRTHKNYGDITKINTSELPDFDFLVGGFPCQAFSIAGKRRGFNDTRGTLFFEIARIIRDKKPKNFLLENVKGLLSHDGGRTFGTILITLDELGYDLQWQVLNSKNFGVPQNRERVFIVGHLRGTSRPEVFPLAGSSSRDYKEGKISATLRGFGHGWQGQHNDTNAVVDGIKIRRLTPTECERLQGFPDGWTEGVSDTQRYKCLGNAVTVNVIQAIMEKLLST